jgi:hypothetical protein
MKIRPIHTKADYKVALKIVSALVAYEAKHYQFNSYSGISHGG